MTKTYTVEREHFVHNGQAYKVGQKIELEANYDTAISESLGIISDPDVTYLGQRKDTDGNITWQDMNIRKNQVLENFTKANLIKEQPKK